MKNSLLMLAGVAALSLASCSQEKTTDTTMTGDGMATTTTTTTTTAMSEADMEARAQRIADKMVADMKITDEATKTKIRTVYVNRYRQMGDMQTRYATDTTGMAAAMRESMATTDAEFKTIFVDPTQYQAYETGRMSYYGMADDNSAMPSSENMGTDMSNSTDAGMMDEGGKMKVKADGDIKIKDAEGNKTKVDGDDGTIKIKEVDGSKTVIK
ncbi:hypothetical protein [Hymenobacter sp. IS2118]|uniref:hypothetical protein n=1 Tax=Hymenobacter sp. IS2118 TaxID=1505605 RepID=UPI00054F7CAF|nr:hypothetical protein [Hymenobacter sp. IS2118]